MQLPSEFKCAGFTIKVIIEDKLPNNDYGYFCDAKNEIRIAKTVEVDKETVQLTNEQIYNTFWHELIHCFQFYYDNEYSEAQAQTFANFMCEFYNTKKCHLVVNTTNTITFEDKP